MLRRGYALMWLLLAAATVGLYVGGNLNEYGLTAVGFFTVTLVFIGMSVMLPASAGQAAAAK